MVDAPATRLAAAPPVVQLAAWSSGGVIDGPRVAFSCARGRAGRRRPQVTGEAMHHRVPVAPRAWTRRPRGAPATPALGARGQGSMREWLGAVMALPIRCCGASIKPRGTANLRERPICGKRDRGRTKRRCAPATPRRREGPGAWQRETLGRMGSSAWAPRCIPSVCPGVGTNPGIAHSVLRKIAQDAQRQMREVPAGPSRSPQRAASERDRSPAWSGFSLGRRIYDGRCAFSGARDDVIPPRSSLVGVRAVARLAGSG
jgi:hypothetical protein